MIIIGHRGARGLAPENTLAGFKKAIELGVDQIEFDVRVSKDGVPVAHHNRFLRDFSGGRLKISTHSYEELKEHKSDLPTLQEALDFINGTVEVCIEVKPREKVPPIVAVLSNYKHPIAIGSKSQRTLLTLHKQLPSVPKVVVERWSGVKATWRARQLKTNYLVMYKYFLWFGFIRAMKKAGYELYVYPMNNPKQAKRWAKYGMAGAITDYPDRFQKNVA